MQERARNYSVNAQLKNTRAGFKNSSSTRCKEVNLNLIRTQPVHPSLHQHHHRNHLHQGTQRTLPRLLYSQVAQRQVQHHHEQCHQDHLSGTQRHRIAESHHQYHPPPNGCQVVPLVHAQRLYRAAHHPSKDPLQGQQQHGGQVLQLSSHPQEDTARSRQRPQVSFQLEGAVY